MNFINRLQINSANTRYKANLALQHVQSTTGSWRKPANHPELNDSFFTDSLLKQHGHHWSWLPADVSVLCVVFKCGRKRFKS